MTFIDVFASLKEKCFVKQEHDYLQKAKLIDAKRVQAATSRQIMVDCILAATSSTWIQPSSKKQQTPNSIIQYQIHLPFFNLILE